MKIAISAESSDSQSRVDPRFGRAPWFVVYDTEEGLVESIDNVKSTAAMQGAGVQTASRLSSLGIGAVIAGHYGPKAHSALAAAGIEAYSGEGLSVSEAFEAFKKGSLPEMSGADRSGHWR